MSDVTWGALAATDLREVRRRAAVVHDVVGAEPVAVPGAQRLAWNDRAGQSTVWYFTEDGRALLLTFDHESDLNLYAEEDFALQESFFEGVPESLVALLRDRPENYESLNLTDPETERTIHYAGGVFWYDGSRWHVADGVAEHCRQEGLDLFRESGFDYCLKVYRFGQSFDPETFVALRDERGRYKDEEEKEADLTRLRDVFARHD
ncbi:hypothetical protein G3I20_17960 [Streptomyces sp. SID8111]|uniref:hypothetical protein n=1 Tax=Streptomyces sp. SID8111 TaxID=2706100 RepID=UPI0013C04381|nr:hypothetical protein [Streptomyces sp. SID8111]NEC28403.1 hypothetical protein [Streptomyces sp. SID8111]